MKFEVAIPNKIFAPEDKWLVPPVLLSYEKGVFLDDLVVGGSLGYTSSSSIKYKFQNNTYRHISQYALIRLYSSYYYSFSSLDRFTFNGTVGAFTSFGFRNFKGNGELENFEIKSSAAPWKLKAYLGIGVLYELSDRFEALAQFNLGHLPVTIGIAHTLQN